MNARRRTLVAPGTLEESNTLVDIYAKGDDPAQDEPLGTKYEVTSTVTKRGRIYIARSDRSQLARLDEDVDVYLH